MSKLHIYLYFNGTCREAFALYQSVFGGETHCAGTFADMPQHESAAPIPEAEKDRIMHMRLPIGGTSLLMGSDMPQSHGANLTSANSMAISVEPAGRSEAERIFADLSAGGSVTIPLGDTFWGAYFGSLTDRYGVNWLVSYEQPAD